MRFKRRVSALNVIKLHKNAFFQCTWLRRKVTHFEKARNESGPGGGAARALGDFAAASRDEVRARRGFHAPVEASQELPRTRFCPKLNRSGRRKFVELKLKIASYN
jgi:hypothetical protein